MGNMKILESIGKKGLLPSNMWCVVDDVDIVEVLLSEEDCDKRVSDMNDSHFELMKSHGYAIDDFCDKYKKLTLEKAIDLIKDDLRTELYLRYNDSY